MKEIKDYLHLYLGCEFMIEDVHIDRQLSAWDLVQAEKFPEETLKPILRPLSDMTEEEFKKLCNDILDYHPTDIYKQNDAIWGRSLLTKERCRLSFDLSDYYTIHFWVDFTSEDKKVMPPLLKINLFANQCRRLSFDMDGLIESGLAIDKTKQK